MTWLLRLFGLGMGADHGSAAALESTSRLPELPIDFVRRSDPSYYFLVRQHWD